MRTLRSWLGLVGTLALAGLPASSAAQPVGSEFQVNTYTTRQQAVSAVAADANGNFVVVWQSYPGQDGSGSGIFGQRYDAAGAALGAEFRVNSYTTSSQSGPSVASDASGNFVVVWHSLGQDGSGAGIFGQRYDNTGVALGAEFQVNSYTTSGQFAPSVASDVSGNFVVVWQGVGDEIFGQRYDSEGVRRGGEFMVNTSTDFYRQYPTVASAADGSFVVAWNGFDYIYPDSFIFGQRYDSQGMRLGGEFNVFGGGPIDVNPQVASDPRGNFVVVWSSHGFYSEPLGIWGQRYDSDGMKQGGAFQIATGDTAFQDSPSVAADAHGNFLVAWGSRPFAGSAEILGQRYDSEGIAVGNEFLVNSHTAGHQGIPSVAATDVNQFVVAWDSPGQDGDGLGVFGQRFAFSGNASTSHVGDLDGRAKDVAASWRAQVKTLVHDDAHSPLNGVFVIIDVSGVGQRNCTTTAAGQCEVSVVVPDSVPSLTFTVTRLRKTGFTYIPAANHDPDSDSDGTVIVVNQP